MAALPLGMLRSLARRRARRKWDYLCKEVALETRKRWVIAERQEAVARAAEEGYSPRQAEEGTQPKMDGQTALAKERRDSSDPRDARQGY